jgi:hypothetical protein
MWLANEIDAPTADLSKVRDGQPKPNAEFDRSATTMTTATTTTTTTTSSLRGSHVLRFIFTRRIGLTQRRSACRRTELSTRLILPEEWETRSARLSS